MRVLLIGDGIALTSGFAQVLRHIAAGLVAQGVEVAQITSLDAPPACRSEPYTALGVEPFFPSGEPVGTGVLQEVLHRWQPDAVVINSDPGQAAQWLIRLQGYAPDLPVVLYAPVEGAPVNKQFCQTFAAVGVKTLLYTSWASRVVAEQSGADYPWVWHGVDADVFRPLPADERAAVREALGWTNRFVVTYVGRNCGRKAQDVLIEAMAQVKRTTPEALLYLHCAPFDGYWGNGWDLNWLCDVHDVADVVEFPSRGPSLGRALRGEPVTSLGRKLAASDLYVHPAQVEGFGLPLIEAMSAGLPVISVADAGNMDEVMGDAAMGQIAPFRRQTWFTGAELCQTLPDQWAQAIHWASTKPAEREAASLRSQSRARDFGWEPMVEEVLSHLGIDAPSPVVVG